jgi:hypothetical protein
MTEQTRDPDALLARYADGPVQLEAALAGLGEADLDVAQTAGTWTIRQIVHHITDGDDLWKTCIKIALGNSSGLFSLRWYWDMPQDVWVERWDYAGRAIEPSLALFRVNRCHIVQLVQQMPDAWDRCARIVWPDGQEKSVSVGYVIEMQGDHAMGHIDNIRTIRQSHNL